jgi:hypothetical protein
MTSEPAPGLALRAMTAGKRANQVIEHSRATEQRTADELPLALDIYERLHGRIVRSERRG